MADAGAQARIQDLKRRIDLDPGSRLFVALAEEYRKSGRLAEALSTLQQGLLSHPNYLSAQVALGRAHLESGQVTEAIATFSKVLGADPGNLVSAKSLADIYLSRGETVEAIKKYKLYRAISGDRTVDGVIARLDKDLLPPPPPRASAIPDAPVPPPPTFLEQPAGPVRRAEFTTAPSEPASASDDPFDLSPVSFEPLGMPLSAGMAEPFAAVTPEPVAAPAPPPATGADASADVATRAFRLSEILGEPGRRRGAAVAGGRRSRRQRGGVGGGAAGPHAGRPLLRPGTLRRSPPDLRRARFRPIPSTKSCGGCAGTRKRAFFPQAPRRPPERPIRLSSAASRGSAL